MKHITWFVVFALVALVVVTMIACESHKDPFSAKNTAPGITDFRFKPDPNLPNISSDSLKFRAQSIYLLHLEYQDPEFQGAGRALQAHFKFISGGGRIRNDSFLKPSLDSLSFSETPAVFNDDLLFTPDTSGLVSLEVRLSDGVKESAAGRASVFFFENLAPLPVFSVRTLSLANPYQIEFDPRSSRDRDGRIVAYQWNFGDDSTAVRLSGNPFSHFYRLAGQYRVRLRVVDEDGKADSTEQLVTTDNQSPVAALRVLPLSGKVPLEIDYNAAGSFDPDGEITNYQIFFGDGATSQASVGKHIYENDANYQVLLIVRDNFGLADTTSAGVRVATPPVAVLNVDHEQGPYPLTVHIDGRESLDPHPNGGIAAYRIFIDSQQLSTQDSITTVLSAPGTFLVALEVDNIRGLTDRTEKIVRALNLPPVADFIFSPLNPQPTVNVNFTSTSSDPNRTDRITNYTWNWGDGSQEQSGSTLTTLQHEFAAGDWLVKLTVTDSFGLVGEKTVQLHVAN